MATGSVDLFRTFQSWMYERTQIALVDSTGLVNTSIGRHLYAWDPPETKEMFVNSAHASVCNSFAIRGLEVLAEMAAAAGKNGSGREGINATRYRQQAASMKAAFLTQLGDPSAKRFCDGAKNAFVEPILGS
jgi:DNA-binding IclR family transcriptional regulator